MQYSKIGEVELSRLGLGTKRLPRTDITHVVRVNRPVVHEIVQAAQDLDISFVDTSYSAGKGEAEAVLGNYFAESGTRMKVSTSFFEMVDPRYDYVFQKQLKKLETETIDLYHVEGMNDITKESVIDTGAVDYLFEQKEAGRIANLGFTSELNGQNLEAMLNRYPWDFVRLRINFFEWFQKTAREQYEVAAQAGIPMIAHGALRVGPAPLLKPEALEVLENVAPGRTQAEWCLRFVKSLDAVSSVAVNVQGISELQADAAAFNDEEVLSKEELEALEKASGLQRIVKRVS